MVQHQRIEARAERDELVQRMVVNAIHQYGCRKLGDVVERLHGQDNTIDVAEVRDAINKLRGEDKIEFVMPVEESFLNHLRSLSATPLWLTVSISLATVALVYLLPDTGAFSAIRIVAGGGLILFLPGYSLVKFLFPAKSMDLVEQIALSVGLSLAITPLIGVMLNSSLWGVKVGTVIISLSTLCIGLSMGCVYRRFLLLQRQKLP